MPENQLAAARLERIEIGTGRVEEGRRLRRVFPERRELVARVVPRRVAQVDVLEHLGAERKARARRRLSRNSGRASGDPCRPPCGLAFTANRLRRINHAVLILRLAVNRLQRVPLRVGQACERRHVDPASPRIFHQSIFEAVDRVAFVEDLRLHGLQDLRRE